VEDSVHTSVSACDDEQRMRLRVSVVIVNWNTRVLLQDCLERLEADRKECEVIVVDNGSRDGSAAMVRDRFPDVQLLDNESNLGYGRAVNQAYAAARGDYVLLLNSDTRVSEGAISFCARYFDEHDDVGIVGCRLRFADGRVQSSCFRFPGVFGLFLTSFYISQLFRRSYLLNWDRYGYRDWPEPRQVDCVMGSFFMIRRRAVDQEPLLDEGYYMYGEETDLCYRLKQRGWRTMFLPGAEIVHHHGGSTKTPRLAAWATHANNRGILRFIHKWRGSRAGWVANAIVTTGILARAPGWVALDLLQGLRENDFAPRRMLKAKCLRFHLAALLRPGLLDTTWKGPDAVGSPDR